MIVSMAVDLDPYKWLCKLICSFLFFISLSRPGSIRLRGLLFLPGQSAVRAGFILKRMLDVSQSTENPSKYRCGRIAPVFVHRRPHPFVGVRCR